MNYSFYFFLFLFLFHSYKSVSYHCFPILLYPLTTSVPYIGFTVPLLFRYLVLAVHQDCTIPPVSVSISCYRSSNTLLLQRIEAIACLTTLSANIHITRTFLLCTVLLFPSRLETYTLSLCLFYDRVL